jgi:hypothetical protein
MWQPTPTSVRLKFRYFFAEKDHSVRFVPLFCCFLFPLSDGSNPPLPQQEAKVLLGSPFDQ